MKPLKRMIGEIVNDLSVNPRYASDFEQSVRRRVFVRMVFEPPWEYAVDVVDGIPGIRIVVTVPRGGYSRVIYLNTTLEYLHGHGSRETVDTTETVD